MITWIILKAAEDLSTGTRVAPSDAYLMREAIRRHQSEQGRNQTSSETGPQAVAYLTSMGAGSLDSLLVPAKLGSTSRGNPSHSCMQSESLKHAIRVTHACNPSHSCMQSESLMHACNPRTLALGGLLVRHRGTHVSDDVEHHLLRIDVRQRQQWRLRTAEGVRDVPVGRRGRRAGHSHAGRSAAQSVGTARTCRRRV